MQPDSADDFAGRVVDQWVQHELRRSNEVLLELGIVFALFHVRAEEERRQQNLSERRHAPDNEARGMVVRDWEKNPDRFGISVAKASVGYSGWLVKLGYKKFAPRVVAGWIYK